MARKRLGELLVERKLVTPAQLIQGLAYQRKTGHRLGSALVALGFLTEEALCATLAQELGITAVTKLPEGEVDWGALHTLRGRFCEANDVFPLAVEAGTAGRKVLVLGMADPLNIPAIEEIEFTTGLKVRPVIAPLSGIRAAIRRHYMKQAPQPGALGDTLTVMHRGGESVELKAGEPSASQEVPVIELEPVDEVAEGGLTELIGEREAAARRKRDSLNSDLGYLFGVKDDGEQGLEALERKFWALLRIMARKGLLTKEEFLKEIENEE